MNQIIDDMFQSALNISSIQLSILPQLDYDVVRTNNFEILFTIFPLDQVAVSSDEGTASIDQFLAFKLHVDKLVLSMKRNKKTRVIEYQYFFNQPIINEETAQKIQRGLKELQAPPYSDDDIEGLNLKMTEETKKKVEFLTYKKAYIQYGTSAKSKENLDYRVKFRSGTYLPLQMPSELKTTV